MVAGPLVLALAAGGSSAAMTTLGSDAPQAGIAVDDGGDEIGVFSTVTIDQADVPSNGTIEKLEVQVAVDHSQVGSLKIDLWRGNDGYDGASPFLLNNPGSAGQGSGFDTDLQASVPITFDDQANLPNGYPAYSSNLGAASNGTDGVVDASDQVRFRPADSDGFSAFDTDDDGVFEQSELVGDWTIAVVDSVNTSQDLNAQFQDWQLNAVGPGVPTPSSLVGGLGLLGGLLLIGRRRPRTMPRAGPWAGRGQG